MNGLNNFDISLLDRYLDIYDAIEKALMDHMTKPSMKRMTSQAAVAIEEGRVEETWCKSQRKAGFLHEDKHVMNDLLGHGLTNGSFKELAVFFRVVLKLHPPFFLTIADLLSVLITVIYVV